MWYRHRPSPLQLCFIRRRWLDSQRKLRLQRRRRVWKAAQMQDFGYNPAAANTATNGIQRHSRWTWSQRQIAAMSLRLRDAAYRIHTLRREWRATNRWTDLARTLVCLMAYDVTECKILSSCAQCLRHRLPGSCPRYSARKHRGNLARSGGLRASRYSAAAQ